MDKTDKFARTEQLVGKDALARLGSARVGVFGLGGVGSYTVEALVRSGIGYLRLVDFDVVTPANFNRQLYALDSTLGKSKVEVAERRAFDINPDCVVETHKTFFNRQTRDQLLDDSLDVVVDAIDSLDSKIELLHGAVTRNIQVISSMGAASRTDFSKIEISDMAGTHGCPLARLVRKRLKKKGVERGITCVFSVEAPAPSGFAGTEDSDDEAELGGQRRPIGSLSYMTGIFGLIIAGEVLARISNHGVHTSVKTVRNPG